MLTCFDDFLAVDEPGGAAEDRSHALLPDHATSAQDTRFLSFADDDRVSPIMMEDVAEKREEDVKAR